MKNIKVFDTKNLKLKQQILSILCNLYLSMNTILKR